MAIWAALSTSGLRGLRLPAEPGRLTIGADGDTPGREAAHALAERAHALGWTVGFLDPGEGARLGRRFDRKGGGRMNAEPRFKEAPFAPEGP